jgi:pimeloyl-ACP methyl ester carboxylesterase
LGRRGRRLHHATARRGRGRFIDALNAGPVHLVGHSRGGHIAFRVAQHIPTGCGPWSWRSRAGPSTKPCGPAQGASVAPAPQRMSLAEATAGAAERIRRGDVEGGRGLLRRCRERPRRVGGHGRAPERMHRDNACTLIGQVNERRRPFSRTDVEAIRAPTLLIGGEKSRRISGRCSTRWKAGSPTRRARPSPAPGIS